MEKIGIRVCPACGALVSESDPCWICVLRRAVNLDTSVVRSAAGCSRFQLDFEHYRVLRNPDGTPVELGRGAMGVTYKALDINLQCVVALKVINVEFVGDQSACHRFVREARAAARVRDENVASVFHLGKQGVSYFYAMELVDGEPLDRVIRRAGRLETAAALRVIRFVATGLEAIASQNLVHRDIKPSNIVVRLAGNRIVQAKIIDLGLAKSAVEDEALPAISCPGSFAGTPAYASPEQFAGIGADIRSDLYSLGVTLWQMLCGELPFRGSALELSDQHQYAPLPIHKLSQIPRPIATILEILLEKDPSRRYQRPAELVEAVVKILEPEKWWITTDRLGSKRPAVHSVEVLRNRRRVESELKRLGSAWLLVTVIGLFGLMSGWHSVPTSVRPWIGWRNCAPVEQSISVLPFENISLNKEDSYLADGVQDEVLRRKTKSQAKSQRRKGKREIRNSRERAQGTQREDGER